MTPFRLLALFAVVAVPAALAADSTTSWQFEFGTDHAAAGAVAVNASAVYSREAGFGFEPGSSITVVPASGSAPSSVTSAQPFYFSVAVPEGNYRVTVTLGDSRQDAVTTVKAETRRLMLEQVRTRAGQSVQRTFTVNVRGPKLRDGSEVNLDSREMNLETHEAISRTWDDKLTLEFSGTHAAVSAVTIEKAPNVMTFFITGDSTVTDQPNWPAASWGQMATRWFKPDVVVANHAESGETLKGFLKERRWDKVLESLRPGDYVLIEFGTNDSKSSGPQNIYPGQDFSETYAPAETTYKERLRRFVADVQKRGGHPIIASPSARRGETSAPTSLEPWAKAAMEVARELNVSGIDLNAMGVRLNRALGPDADRQFADRTHHVEYGAYLQSKCIVLGLQEAKVPLAAHIVDDFHFDPDHPEPKPAEFDLPPEPRPARGPGGGRGRAREAGTAAKQSPRPTEIMLEAEIQKAGTDGSSASLATQGPLAQAIPLAAIPAGPVSPTWDSLRANWHRPQWFDDAKFGLSMHWGLYSVPARQSEWYVRYMYGGNPGIMRDHIAKYGPLDKFGYKDFIPMFTAAKWDPDAWAMLFKKSGAKFIVPTVEHHDGYSLWNSAYNKYNAKRMGPKRDLVADLAAAVRKQGLKFGVANHSIEHFDFIPVAPNSDQNDPEWKEFYHTADRSAAERIRFNRLWLAKNIELIDTFHPDLLWFDNGVNARSLDPLKLYLAAYYYNRAAEWGTSVSISTKGDGDRAAYLAGTIHDYERQGRIYPREVKPFAWQVDDPIGNKFGYVQNIIYKPADLLIHRIIDTVAMGGVYMLNLSPLPDGTIPQEQQDRLLAIGDWLGVNGEAIYGTRPWTKYGEGPYADAVQPAWRAPGPDDPPHEAYSDQEVRFTTKGDTLYAIVMGWPENGEAVIKSLASGAGNRPAGTITAVELLGASGALEFTQDATGLHVKFPAAKPANLDHAYALKITGLTLR